MKNSKIYKTKVSDIRIDEEGILWVTSMRLCEIDLEEAMACFEIYKKLGCDQKKVLQLMDFRNNVTITKEARDYVSIHGKNYFIASALVSDSLAARIMVNFFNKFYKNPVPFKMFGDFDSALKWLRAHKKKSKF